MKDLIDRQALLEEYDRLHVGEPGRARKMIEDAPSAQPESKYTVKELDVFRHGVSLRLLSLRSAQHWRYDEETEKEIDFLEQLYEKVREDINHERPD